MSKFTLQNLLNRVDKRDDNEDSLSTRFWSGNLGKGSQNASQNLVNIQDFLNDPDKKFKFGRDKEYNPEQSTVRNLSKIPFNAVKNAGEAIATTLVKAPADLGKMGTMAVRGDIGDFRPGSKPVQFGMNLGEYTERDSNGDLIKKPFADMGYKGKGKWNVPLTDVMMPELGFTESNAFETGTLGLEAFEGPLAAGGMNNVKGMLYRLGFGGFIGGWVESLSGGDFEQGALNTMVGMSPTLAQSQGLLDATNPLVDGWNGPARLPVKSAVNVLQGMAYDKVSETETTGLSIMIDALYPVAEDLGSKAFGSFEEALKGVKGRILQSLGKSLRKSDGTYTTMAKWVAGTRPYRKGSMGAFMGFEMTQNEEGMWEVHYDAKKGTIGLMLFAGGTKALDVIDAKYLEGLDNLDGRDLDNPDGFKSSLPEDYKFSQEEDNRMTKEIGEYWDNKEKVDEDGFNIADIWKKKLEQLKSSQTPADAKKVREELAELNRLKNIEKNNAISRSKINKINVEADDLKRQVDIAYAKGDVEKGRALYKKMIGLKNQANFVAQKTRMEDTGKLGKIETDKVDVSKVSDEAIKEETKTTASILRNTIEESNSTVSTITKRTIGINGDREFEKVNLPTIIDANKAQEKYGIENVIDMVEGNMDVPDDMVRFIDASKEIYKDIIEAEHEVGLGKEVGVNEYYIPHIDDTQVKASWLGRRFLNTNYDTRSTSLMDIFNPLESRTSDNWKGDANISDRFRERFARAQQNIIKESKKLDVSDGKGYIEQIQEGTSAEGRIPFNGKIGIFQNVFKKDSLPQQVLTSLGENSIEGWRDLGPDVFNMIQDLKLSMLSDGTYKSNLVDVYKASPDDPLPFILKVLEDVGVQKGTKEYSDFYGELAGKFSSIKTPESKEKFAWAMATEVGNDRIGKNVLMVENWVKATDIKDPQTKSFVDRELINIFTNGSRESSELSRAVDDARRLVQIASIGGKATTIAVQPLETLRVLSRYGPETGLKSMYEVLSGNKSDYEFLKDYTSYKNYITADGTKIEKNRFEKGLEKLEKIGYYGVAKTEDIKNSIFIKAAEMDGVKNGLEGDELGRYVMDEFEKYALNFSNTSVPELLKNPYMKFFSMYSTYPTKKLGLMLRSLEGAVEKGFSVKNKDAQFLAGMIFTAWVEQKFVGWMFGREKQDAFSKYGYFNTLIGSPPQAYNPLIDTAKSAMNFNNVRKESNKGEYQYEYAKQDLKKNLNRSIVPFGNQAFNVTVPAIKDQIRGYAETPTGNVKYQAPSKPMDIVKSMVFSRYANEEAKNYFNGIENGIKMSLTEKESDAYKQALVDGGDPRTMYDTFIKQNISVTAKNKLKKEVEKTGESAIASESVFYWDDEKESVQEVKLNVDLVMPELSGNGELDEEILVDYNSKLTSRKNDIMKLYYNGFISQKEAVSKIIELDALKKWVKDLKSKASGKTSAYKGSKSKVKAPTMAKIGSSKVSVTNVPKMSTSVPKMPKLAPLSESVINSVDDMKSFVNSSLKDMDNEIANAYKLEPLKGMQFNGY